MIYLYMKNIIMLASFILHPCSEDISMNVSLLNHLYDHENTYLKTIGIFSVTPKVWAVNERHKHYTYLEPQEAIKPCHKSRRRCWPPSQQCPPQHQLRVLHWQNEWDLLRFKPMTQGSNTNCWYIFRCTKISRCQWMS